VDAHNVVGARSRWPRDARDATCVTSATPAYCSPLGELAPVLRIDVYSGWTFRRPHRAICKRTLPIAWTASCRSIPSRISRSSAAGTTVCVAHGGLIFDDALRCGVSPGAFPNRQLPARGPKATRRRVEL